MSVLARLFWTDLVLTVLLVAAVITVENIRSRDFYAKQTESSLIQAFEGTRGPLENAVWSYDQNTAAAIVQGFVRIPAVEHVWLLDEHNRVVQEAEREREPGSEIALNKQKSALAESTLARVAATSQTHGHNIQTCCTSQNGTRRIAFVQLFNHVGDTEHAEPLNRIGSLVVEVSDEVLLTAQASRIKTVAATVVGFGAIFFLVVFFLFRNGFVLPIRNLAKAIRDSVNQLSPAPLIGGGSEIVSLTGHYNRLVKRIQLQISELNQQKEALRKANADLRELDKLKDQFVRMVAHELKTPLTGIRGFAELMQLESEFSPQERKVMSRELVRSADRISTLTDQLLDVMLVESGNLKLMRTACSFSGILQEQLGVVQENRPGRVFEVLGSADTPVNCDPHRVGQIVFQMLDNACKFSPAEAPVRVRLGADDGVCVFEVEDEGTGIPEGFEKRMFTPFSRGHADTAYENDGAGAGLFLAKNIARLHGGDIGYQSRQGGGSIFTLRLPVKADDGVSP